MIIAAFNPGRVNDELLLFAMLADIKSLNL
jgi:hypothetical protein